MPTDRLGVVLRAMADHGRDVSPSVVDRLCGAAVGMVQRTILRLALPGGKPRPKPGAYMGGSGPESAAPQTRAASAVAA